MRTFGLSVKLADGYVMMVADWESTRCDAAKGGGNVRVAGRDLRRRLQESFQRWFRAEAAAQVRTSTAHIPRFAGQPLLALT